MEYIQSISVSDRRETSTGWASALANSLSRIRFQLIGGILVGVFAPAYARNQFERIGDPLISYEHSVIGCTCAILLGYLVFRKLAVLPSARAIVNVVPAFLTSYAVVVTFFFLLRIDYSRAQFVMSFCLTCAWFAFILLIMSRFRRPVFCVAPGAEIDQLRSHTRIRLISLKSARPIERFSHLPIIADLKSASLDPEWERFIAEEAIKGRRILNAKQLAESLTGRTQISHLSENSFGHLAPDSIYGPAKRYVDVLSAMMILAMLWPIFLATALAIRLESKGPAIFKQKRIGFRGNTFTVYKFRSMRVQNNSEQGKENDKTKSDDERITRVGRFIRKTRLDELPQVINILKGDMSWIGPRPETLRLSKWYEDEISFYRYRHIVRPGISGWAQVKQGHVTEVEDIKMKLEYDMYYIKHFSVWLDLLIAVKTISVVFTGKGAR